MTILIDADGCSVVDIAVKVVAECGINIDGLLHERHASKKIRMVGDRLGGLLLS